MGRLDHDEVVPVAGTETFLSKSTWRPGTDSTTGLTETTGVGSLLISSIIVLSISFIKKSPFSNLHNGFPFDRRV
jgi:hypothetical protein